VTAGQVYRINLNEDAAASGLYSIVLRQTSTAVAVPTTVPVPTLNETSLILLIGMLLLAGGACSRRRMVR
jgi:hypothetical protein